MDKNTLIGIVLIFGVIFGFSALRPKKDKAQDAVQTESVQTETATISLDSITPAEMAQAADIIRAAGTLSAAGDSATPAVYTLETAGVALTAKGGEVTGTVDAIGVTLDYNDVVAGAFADSLTQLQKQEAIKNLRSAIDNAARYQSFARFLNGTESTVTIHNDVLSLDINNHGAFINRATLLDPRYRSMATGPGDTTQVEIISPIPGDYYAFELTTASQRISTRNFYFTATEVTDSSATMLLQLENGSQWGLRYTLTPGSYVVKMDIVQKDMDRIIPPSVTTARFEWAQRMVRNESGRTFEQQNSDIAYKEPGSKPGDLGSAAKTRTLDQDIQWIGFKNQFFSTIIVPSNGFETAWLNQIPYNDSPDYLKDMAARTTFSYSSTLETPATFNIFIGPNLYPLLRDLSKEMIADTDLELQRILPLGWGIFRWINTLIIIPVFTFLSNFISSYGLIILLLTIFIKLILFPLTYKSYISQAKMRLLAPEIKEINEKYPGNDQAMARQQKTMALYSRAGASPMSGCLPMLLQMPILFAMFKFFPSCIELRGESFLWAKNLAAPDVVLNLPFTIPMYGSHVSLFCLLMTATNIIYTRINMANSPTQQTGAMKWMMYLMPVFFLVFFNQYAAALSYYYFLSLLITIGQTYLCRRFVNEKKLREHMLAQAAKPRKKSGFMARLEEAQRKQQAAMREQQKKKGNRR